MTRKRTVFVKDKDDRGKVIFREKKVLDDDMTLSKRRKLHSQRHPNDTNSKNKQKGIFWGKTGQRDKALKKFYKEHIYTFVDENDLSRKMWVRISGFKGEEQ